MKKPSLPMSLLSLHLAQAQISRLIKRLSGEIETLKKELRSLPDGRLYIKKSRRWINYYINVNGQTKGISKDKKLIYQLARREYILLLIPFLEEFVSDHSIDSESETIKQHMHEFDMLFSRFKRGSLDIDKITMTPNQYIWNSDRSSKKNNRRDELIYPTTGRVLMRTKSEQMLGNLLERLHIPYRYECALYINGINYHPDFVIMLPDDRLIIIEHTGRLDLKGYDEDLIYRLQAYNHAGLLIGRDVFFTFERDTRDELIAKEVLFQAISSVPSDSKYLKSVAAKAGCRFA